MQARFHGGESMQRDEGGMGKTVGAARIVSTLLLIKFEMLAEEE